MAKKQIVGNLVTEVSADNSKFKASLQEASKIANSSQFKIKSSFQKILPTTKQLEKGFATATGAVIAFTAAIGVSVKKFADFETDFTNVVTLLDEGSFKLTDFKTGVDNLKKGILDLGKKTGQPFNDINLSLFDTISAGVEAEQSISVLTSALELSKAGATQTKVAIDGITSALDAYGLGSEMSRKVAEKFYTAQKYGKTTVEELSNNFGKAGATANAFGVSLNELFAATAAATTGGIRTEAAFTGLNAILANVSKPTSEAKEEAKRLGIEFNSTALRAQGLTKFLDSISKSSGFTQTSIERLFGSIEAQKIAFALTGGSAETFKNILTELSNETQTAATFQNAYNRVMETTGVTIAKVAREFEAFQIEIGENAAPAVNDLVGEFIKLEEQTQGVSNSIKAVTVILQILVGTFKELLLGGEAIGEFLAKIGIAFDNAGKKMTAFKALTGGVGEFTVDVVKEFNKAGDAIDSFGKKSANLKVGGSTKINLDIPNSTKIDWNNLKNNINDTVDAANKAGNGLKDLNDDLDKDAAKKYANSIADLQHQLSLLGKTEREIAILNAERDLKGADPKQVKQAKDLAAQYYDQKEALDGIEEEQKKLIEIADDVGSILTSNFRDAIFEAESFSDVLNNIGLQLLELTFQRSILDPLAGSISTGFSSLLGFADGGRPPMNKPSIVGERGAELFVPDTSGTIIPNEVLSSGVNTGTTIYADLRGASLEAVQRLEAYVQSINASLEKRSVAAVADANRRNPRLLRT